MKDRKRRVLEVIEGGLRGGRGSRIFSWVAFVLIILSNSFLLLSRMEEPGEKFLAVFVVVELLTILLFTVEVILGFWTANVRFPDDPHPCLRYLRQPMTLVAILAILPFYLELILLGERFDDMMEMLELLSLLHLVKAWEIMRSARKEE